MITEAKWSEIGERIEHVSIAIARSYAAHGSQFESEELAQQMWVELLERQNDQSLMTRPVNQIVNLAAWRTKNWVTRGEIRHANHESTNNKDSYRAMLASRPWPAVEDNLDLPWLKATISRTITALGGTTEIVARTLMTGTTKAQTAREMGLSRATIQYHKDKLATALSQMGVC